MFPRRYMRGFRNQWSSYCSHCFLLITYFSWTQLIMPLSVFGFFTWSFLTMISSSVQSLQIMIKINSSHPGTSLFYMYLLIPFIILLGLCVIFSFLNKLHFVLSYCISKSYRFHNFHVYSRSRFPPSLKKI